MGSVVGAMKSLPAAVYSFEPTQMVESPCLSPPLILTASVKK